MFKEFIKMNLYFKPGSQCHRRSTIEHQNMEMPLSILVPKSRRGRVFL